MPYSALNIAVNLTMSSSSNSISPHPDWVRIVQDQVGAIRFGVVQIVIHESRVVQIERTEKVRFDRTIGEAHPAVANSSSGDRFAQPVPSVL